MRKIEKRMLQAVAGCYDWKESNTQVINNKNGVFVRLYNTIIFAKVGGHNTSAMAVFQPLQRDPVCVPLVPRTVQTQRKTPPPWCLKTL